MEDVAEIVRSVTEPLTTVVCVPEPGKRLCFDFFIMHERAFLFGGDGRDFDPDAGYRASRVQLYLDPTSLQWAIKLTSSRKFGTPQAVTSNQDSATHYKPEDVQITKTAQGEITVTVKFFNTFCKIRVGCPTINASIFLEPDASAIGGFKAGWNRDGYPSMGIYSRKADNSAWDPIAEHPEAQWGPWLSWLRLMSVFPNSVHLPEGCNLS